MIFEETKLPGVFLISLEKLTDSRGFFARSWCQREFEEHGLNPTLVQCNISFNNTAGTLRGLHFQAPPFGEDKLVRCTKGSIFDVIVDIRQDSATYLRWIGVELSGSNYQSVYIPSGLAHGFQTLVDNTEVLYQMSEFYTPRAGRGLRWNDPKLSISWPIGQPILSEKDMNHPLL